MKAIAKAAAKEARRYEIKAAKAKTEAERATHEAYATAWWAYAAYLKA